MNQKDNLKILFVEDVPSDIDLAVLELRKEKLTFEYTTVCTRNDLVKALNDFNPDLIISDYMMPAFNGLQALQESKAFNADIPFILFTGSVNEETAVECLKAGAQDYVIKEHMTRLPFAVKEALIQVEVSKERKESEKALRESQHLFQTLSRVSPVGIFRTKADGYTTYVNPAWYELSGLSEEEAIGFQWLKAVHPDDRVQLEQGWHSAVNHKKTSSAEYRFLRTDGSIVWVMGKAVPEMNGEQIIGYIGTITDITERKNAEIALKKSEEKYRRIFENVQDVYFETTLEGTILEISPSINSLSKGLYIMSDLIGRPMSDLYMERLVMQQITVELNRKGFVSDYEVSFTDHKELIIPCAVSAKYILDHNGHPDKIIGSIHDITDRKNASDALKMAKEKAEISDKLKTDFLNNISHEVRTPLNGILGFAEIISLQGLSEEERKDSLAMLFESSNRLLNTITNYMDISLITSGSLSVNKKNFAPSNIIRLLFNNFEPSCVNRKLKLILDLPDNSDDIVLNSDQEICQKILSHFLDNSVKFTENGSIRLGFNIDQEQLEFFVRDTGIGINATSFNTIFDRFAKEEVGSFKGSEGSGLGLSIAKGMSEAIGGKIRLDSKPGIGSCFYLSIPVKEHRQRLSGDAAGKKVNRNKSLSPILVAEDDETNFSFLNALLMKETGAKILHGSTGKETIELFKINPDIKLILMDIKMPDMDGFEATRQIRMINKDVHIIAVTAYAMSGDEERIMAAGFDEYLSKPINKKNLLGKIEKFYNS